MKKIVSSVVVVAMILAIASVLGFAQQPASTGGGLDMTTGILYFSNPVNFIKGQTGVTSGAVAPAGSVGQVISSLVPVGSGVALTTVTAAQMTSLALTPGDWDVTGSVVVSGTGTTIAAGSLQEASINSGTGCSAPAQVTDGSELFLAPPALTTTSAKFGASLARKVFNVSANTTVCIIATTTFTAGSEVAYGQMVARRVR